ncbi:hypothetical protein [Carnobacterium maltaromaticum]|uniref:hypothetical protein n=1 Tax=Carnobacterium maltaromaticum TaxID=2751 RepID=UPI0039BE7C55
MGSIFTVIASIIAAVASIVATVMVWYQGKKNRKLTSIINYKINALNLTIERVSEYLSCNWKIIESELIDKTTYFSESKDMERMDLSRKLKELTYEMNIYLNYDNQYVDEIGTAISNIVKERESLLSRHEKIYLSSDSPIEKIIDDVIIAVKKYTAEEWKLINKEL